MGSVLGDGCLEKAPTKMTHTRFIGTGQRVPAISCTTEPQRLGVQDRGHGVDRASVLGADYCIDRSSENVCDNVALMLVRFIVHADEEPVQVLAAEQGIRGPVIVDRCGIE